MVKEIKYKAGDYLGKNKNILMLDRIDNSTGLFECPICGEPFEAKISDVNRVQNKVCKKCGTSNYKHFPGEYLGVNHDILFVKRLDKNEHGDYRGLFQCPYCKELFEARVSAVASGEGYQSCGCQKQETLRDMMFNKPKEDLTGQRFGKLVVLGIDEDRKDGRLKFKCKCDCGNIVSVEGYSLKDSSTTSCGCLKSKGEEKISSILNSLGIDRIPQKKFDTCKDEKLLSFDFYLPDYNLLIEYNGVQHYKSGSGWNNEEKLEKTQLHDKTKKEWAENNNIPLLVISYKEYDLLDEEYLMNKIIGTAGKKE